MEKDKQRQEADGIGKKEDRITRGTRTTEGDKHCRPLTLVDRELRTPPGTVGTQPQTLLGYRQSSDRRISCMYSQTP